MSHLKGVLFSPVIIAVLLAYSTLSEEFKRSDEGLPYFSRPIGNITVALGKEATLSCSVQNLGFHKVAWTRAEDRTVLSLDTHVITQNPRISITGDIDRGTWNLTIRKLKQSDKGCYMCQINTDKMKKQIGCLDVHVPPEILDEKTSADTAVKEGENVTLVCTASGNPQPKILWRREDGRIFTVFIEGKGYVNVENYTGERLHFVRTEYTQMGAYLCIASNDIPPSVSKRIVLLVRFPPILKLVSRQVGTELGTTATLRCVFHAFPNDATSWSREIGDIQDHGGNYTSEVSRSWYEVQLLLTIRNIRVIDFGRYTCRVSNTEGVAGASIQIYEVRTERRTTPRTTTSEVTARPFHEVPTEKSEETASVSDWYQDLMLNEIEREEPEVGVEASSRRRHYKLSGSSVATLKAHLIVPCIIFIFLR